jgi:hypothetical protein
MNEGFDSPTRYHTGQIEFAFVLSIFIFTESLVQIAENLSSAKQLAEHFGNTIQDKQIVSLSDNTTWVTNPMQLEMAIPQSTIS